jgi:pyruvate/2-oxoglutarate dehydrogenase complex dihydrolipoamide acyltransferase (E2) component
MTERVRRHVRKGWNLTKVGALLLILHQAVDLRLKVQTQQARELATASTVAAMQKDIGKLATDVDRLKRQARKGSPGSRAAADSLSSPGPIEVATSIVTAPFRLLGALGKALLGG